MKKQVLLLLDDRWHHKEQLEPVLPVLFPDTQWEREIITDPRAFLLRRTLPALLVTFKDVIENQQSPIPLWCDEIWSAALHRAIYNYGMGYLAIHSGIADLPLEHILTRSILQAHFVSLSGPTPLTFRIAADHPITAGLSDFVFREPEEHFEIELLAHANTAVLGYTESAAGSQPGLWAHAYGEGRICAASPGHTPAHLLQPEYQALLQNAAAWCVKNR